MTRELIAPNADSIEPYASHFGVSVGNFLNSLPAIGMTAVDIAQNGLKIVAPKDGYLLRQELGARQLFEGVYATTPSTAREQSDEDSARLIIPEGLEDFCKARNIPAVVVARVGSRLLQFAAQAGAGLDRDLDVYKNRGRASKGSLDSTLSFTISPINTILLHRNSASKIKKITNKLSPR